MENSAKYSSRIEAELVCDHDFQITCDTCRLRALCLPAMLKTSELSLLEGLIEYQQSLHAGELLYLQDQPFTSLYAVLSGAMKTYISYFHGEKHITGFHLPGEVFGFSGIAQNHYISSAQALTSTQVCEIPFDEIGALSRTIPGLQDQLFRLMSRRIKEDHELIKQFVDKRYAQRRIAAFLLSLSARAARRGESSSRLYLPMAQTDVANYLGISHETVSRELARLEQVDVIEVNNRDITIVDRAYLKNIACD